MRQGILIASLFFLLTAPAFAFKKDDIAPDFTLKDREGREFKLSDVVGPNSKEKANGIILNFFASWCAPCRNELPIINVVADDMKKKGVKVVLIAYLEDFDAVQDMLTALKVSKPLVLSDPGGRVGEQYKVRFLPVTFFIGGDGKLKEIMYGEIESEKEMREIAGKLAK
jgi:peroxiredoxin